MMFLGFTTWHIPIDWICQQRKHQKSKAHWSTANQKLIPIMRQILKTNTNGRFSKCQTKTNRIWGIVYWVIWERWKHLRHPIKDINKNNAKLIRTFVVSIIFGVCLENKANRWERQGDFLGNWLQFYHEVFLSCLPFSGQLFSRSFQICFFFSLLARCSLLQSIEHLEHATWKSSQKIK